MSTSAPVWAPAAPPGPVAGGRGGALLSGATSTAAAPDALLPPPPTTFELQDSGPPGPGYGAECAVTLAPGEAIPFLGCQPCDLELRVVPHTRFGFHQCNCRTRQEHLNPHLRGSHLECVMHILPFDILASSSVEDQEGEKLEVASFARTVFDQIRKEVVGEVEMLKNGDGVDGLEPGDAGEEDALARSLTLSGVLLRIENFRNTPCRKDHNSAEETTTFVVAAEPDQDRHVHEAGSSGGEEDVHGKSTSAAVEVDVESYKFSEAAPGGTSCAPAGEADAMQGALTSEPLILRRHLSEALRSRTQGDCAADGEANESCNFSSGVQCVCLDVQYPPAGEKGNSEGPRLVSSYESCSGTIPAPPTPSGSSEGGGGEGEGTARVLQTGGNWPYLSNDACFWLRKTFPEMRVFLINQVSVERENSGGAMFNHRILFADLHPETEAKIDASNPHAVAQKMLPACLGGGEKRPFLIGEGFALDQFQVAAGETGSDRSNEENTTKAKTAAHDVLQRFSCTKIGVRLELPVPERPDAGAEGAAEGEKSTNNRTSRSRPQSYAALERDVVAVTSCTLVRPGSGAAQLELFH